MNDNNEKTLTNQQQRLINDINSRNGMGLLALQRFQPPGGPYFTDPVVYAAFEERLKEELSANTTIQHDYREKCPDCNGTWRDNVPYGDRCDLCGGSGDKPSQTKPTAPSPKESGELKVDVVVDKSNTSNYFLLRRKKDGKYYRGAKYWKWTKSYRRAAILPMDFWKTYLPEMVRQGQLVNLDKAVLKARAKGK